MLLYNANERFEEYERSRGVARKEKWLSTANFPSCLFIKDVFADYTQPKQSKYASVCLLLAAALEE